MFLITAKYKLNEHTRYVVAFDGRKVLAATDKNKAQLYDSYIYALQKCGEMEKLYKGYTFKIDKYHEPENQNIQQ